jgi:hypothetical protein
MQVRDWWARVPLLGMMVVGVLGVMLVISGTALPASAAASESENRGMVAGESTSGDVLSTGRYHTCAIKSNGTASCWGANSLGQSSPPAGLGTVTELSASGSHTCAIKSDGAVACWGNNFAGPSTPPAGNIDPWDGGSAVIRGRENRTSRERNRYAPAVSPSVASGLTVPGGDHP